MKKTLYIAFFLVGAFAFGQSLQDLQRLAYEQANQGGGSVGATPTYTTSYANDGITTSVTVSGISTAANDMLIAKVFLWENATINTPNGWALMNQSNSTSSQAAFWKRANGSESSETFTHSGVGGNAFGVVINKYDGVVTTGTPYESLTTQDAAFQAVHTIQSMTSTGANRLAVGLVFVGDNRTQTLTPSDYTNNFQFKRTTGSDYWLFSYSQNVATASTIPSNNVDFDQTEWGGTINFMLIPR